MHIIILTILVSLILILNFMLKVKHPILQSITCPFSGIISLFLVQGVSIFTGVTLPLNLFTLSFSAFLGIPGVGTLAVINSLLNTSII